MPTDRLFENENKQIVHKTSGYQLGGNSYDHHIYTETNQNRFAGENTTSPYQLYDAMDPSQNIESSEPNTPVPPPVSKLKRPSDVTLPTPAGVEKTPTTSQKEPEQINESIEPEASEQSKEPEKAKDSQDDKEEPEDPQETAGMKENVDDAEKIEEPEKLEEVNGTPEAEEKVPEKADDVEKTEDVGKLGKTEKSFDEVKGKDKRQSDTTQHTIGGTPRRRMTGNYVDYQIPDKKRKPSRVIFNYTDLEPENLYPLQKSSHEMLRRYFRLQSHDENILFSPIGCYFLLNLVASGAQGETATQIAKTLFYRENIEQCTQTAVHLLRLFSYDLVMTFQHCIGMFAQDGLEIQEKFEERLKYDFKGTTERVVYLGSRPSLEECALYSIDKWASDVTENSFLHRPKEEDPDSELAFVDVCFMRAFWDTELPECNTLKDTFTALGQKETRIPYMALCDTFEHIECQSDSFDVAFFPLEAESYGNEWELVVFLPKENSADVLKGITHFMKAKQLRRLKKNCVGKDLDVKLPKFSVQKDVDVMRLLETFGLHDIFSKKKDSADLTGISDRNVGIKYLRQKCSLRVNESGIHPAAGRKQSSSTRKTLPSIYQEHRQSKNVTPFYVTRPFAYCVFQPRAGYVLFAGIIYDPTEGDKIYESQKEAARKSSRKVK